jgi:hypothetical protein
MVMQTDNLCYTHSTNTCERERCACASSQDGIPDRHALQLIHCLTYIGAANPDSSGEQSVAFVQDKRARPPDDYCVDSRGLEDG